MQPRLLPFLLTMLLVGCHESAHTNPAQVQSKPATMLPDSVLAAQQGARAYTLDTVAILSNQRLDTLLTQVEGTRLTSYSSAQALPPVVTAFLNLQSEEEPFTIADVGAPFEKTDNIVDVNLPMRQLVYLGVSPKIVLLSYYAGGIGLSQHVVIFKLKSKTIQDIWSGTVNGDPKTKSDILQQVRFGWQEIEDQKQLNDTGLFF